jgi:diguanylate cyclase (GGDEF)-like protein/PAS domain S-box-containing protein
VLLTDRSKGARPGGLGDAGDDDAAVAGWTPALPAAPALLGAPDGFVVQATEQLARLAGASSPAALVGRRVDELLVAGRDCALLRGNGVEVPVRETTWTCPEDPRLRVTVLTDVSDLVAPRPRPLDVARDQTARVGSWIYSARTGGLYCSPVLDAVLDELDVDRGKGSLDLSEIVHPEDVDRAAEFQRRLLATGEGRVLDVELRDLSGQRAFLITGRAERDATGRVRRLQGTVQELTEHRVLERELRDERRKLYDAQRVARLGSWEWDPQTDQSRFSAMFYEITGIPRGSAATFESYLRATHPDDRAWVEQSWRPLGEQHRPVEIEHRYVRPDGQVRVFHLTGTAVRDREGRTLLVGTCQDVTEQRTAASRVERSYQRFSDLVSITPVGIGLFDQDGRLVDANPALCGLLGHPLEQLRGTTAGELTRSEEPGWDFLDPAAPEPDRPPQRTLVTAGGEQVDCELHVSLSVRDDGTRFWLVVFQDITERRRIAEALHHQATHDELTGLPNRSSVKERLARLLREAPDRVAVLFCDIDNFKRVNDSLGHDAGDELLIALARRLENGLPESCTAARLSGDEFVVLCSDLAAVHGVDALAAKVSSLLRTAVPVHGQLVRVSASIGAAVPDSGSATPGKASGADLLRFADAALFEAKRSGAGRVSTASPALMASADRQLHLEGQLREALHGDQLQLHYQPVVDGEGRVLSAEALVRWPHPQRGVLGPDAFLPVAEQGDLMRELDRWVLRTALREAASWPERDGLPVGIAVNLAALVPGGPQFVEAVGEVVEQCGIRWDRVVLELVETALVDLPSATRAAMGELTRRGVRFAVDDFGTGYSSLARLKDLPAQIVKLDRRFVSGVDADPSDFAVARAVVDMARGMGRACVAEGIETASQLDVLSRMGVTGYQGWLFSRGVPAEQFRELLGAGSLLPARAGR